MNLLKMLGLVRSLNGLSLFSLRPSNGLRSGDLIRSTPTAAANKGPCWVMLNRLVYRMDDTTATDAKSMAKSHTRTGRQFRVALALAPPPMSSFLYYDWVNGAPSCRDEDIQRVIAAHRDGVLFEIIGRVAGSNYFVYRVGASRRPPSLSLLPTPEVPIYIEHWSTWEHKEFGLSESCTGMLRRGEEELLVASLTMNLGWPDLLLLRFGGSEWELKKAVPIVAGTQGDEPVPSQCIASNMVVPVGDRFLCWVNYYQCVLVCDMTEERPKLRYVPLPVVPPCWKENQEDGNRPPIENSRDMCGTGDGTLRFVSIDLRCCCGGFGMSTCEHSRSAFMITTWSLSLSTSEPMAWVRNTVLHCEDLWALPGYNGLPRTHPEFPAMSLHNPDVVYFRVSEDSFFSFKEERKAWMVEVDTRVKVLLSIVPCTIDAQRSYIDVATEL